MLYTHKYSDPPDKIHCRCNNSCRNPKRIPALFPPTAIQPVCCIVLSATNPLSGAWTWVGLPQYWCPFLSDPGLLREVQADPWFCAFGGYRNSFRGPAFGNTSRVGGSPSHNNPTSGGDSHCLPSLTCNGCLSSSFLPNLLRAAIGRIQKRWLSTWLVATLYLEGGKTRKMWKKNKKRFWNRLSPIQTSFSVVHTNKLQ